jgi:hypothetical protein
MKMQISKWIWVAFSFLTITGFYACSKENSQKTNEGNARVQISLTDAPNVEIREVWVDIKGIMLNMGDSSNWITLNNTHPGIYNLLDLTNGKDTLLADAEIPAGRISQIRLLLGDQNSIVTKDGQTLALTTPSAQQSGLKIQVQQDVSGGILYRLILDFDAGKSVVQAGNSGKFILKPVIRVTSFEPSGGIVKGVVAPDSVRTAIYAIKGMDTIASTYSDTTNGQYQLWDIPGGDYNFSYVPMDTSFKSAAAAVSVVNGQSTVVDTVVLEKK